MEATRGRQTVGDRWHALSDVFVGRHAEVDAAQRLLRALRIGSGATVFVSGEPGAGKTALLSRFVHAANDARIPVYADWRWRTVDVSRPALVVADDLHLLSRAELDDLFALTLSTSTAPLLVVAAHLRASGGQLDSVSRFLARVTHDQMVVRLGLTGLSLDEVEDYLAMARVTLPGRHAIARAIHERTGGNPFLVREVVSLWLSRRVTDGDALVSSVPDGVADVVRSRLAHLGAAARRVIEYAAVADAAIDVRVLSVATGIAGPLLVDLLDEAARFGFLCPDDGRGYRFAHQLTQEAVLNTLSHGERATVHGDLARALEDLFPREGARSAEISRHFAEAALLRPELRPRAAHYAYLAAGHAAQQHRWEQAAALYALAADYVDDGRVDDGAGDRIDCLASAGRCWEAAGEPRKAWQSFMAAVDGCRDRGDGRRLAEVVLAGLRDIDVPRRRRLELADEAIDIARSLGDRALLARLLAVRGAEDDTPDAEGHIAEARALATQLGLRDVLDRLARRDFTHAVGNGDMSAARAQLLAERARIASCQDARSEADQLLRVAEIDVRAGEMSAGWANAEAALAFATKHEVRTVAMRARRYLAAIALARGDIEVLDDLAGQIWDRPVERQLLVRRAEILGEYALAASLIPAEVAPGADHPRVSWDLTATRARIALASGDWSRAAGYLSRWAADRLTRYHPLDRHDGLATSAEALVELGDEATQLAVLQESTARPGVRFSPLAATGLDRLRGLLALRLGYLADAARWIDQALAWSQEHQLRTEQVLAGLARAELLLASGQWDAAALTGRQALEDAREYGLAGVAGRIEAWLDAARQRADGDAVELQRLLLTRREEEILRLVADGRTNQQIAMTLQISPHTANRHLSNILGKLSVANRAEAVKRASDLGLFSTAASPGQGGTSRTA